MGTHPDGPATPSRDARGLPAEAPAPRRRDEVIPLAALALTTLLLAASAFRVVASSIVETRPIVVPAPPRPVPPAPDPALVRNAAPAPVGDTPPPPPPVRVEAPPPPGPSILPISTPTPAADRAPPPPPVEVPAGLGQSKPPPPKPAALVGLPPAPASDARRVMVRDEDGRPVVARVLGKDGDRTAVLLPDGQVGWPDGLIFTERPFAPLTKEALRDRLREREFAGFQAILTPHYVVLYQSSDAFARASANVLEGLYSSLGQALNRRDVPVHEAEFPLVAVIFKSEDDFRRHKPVAPEVQAYYEILSNRIFLFEKSLKDQAAPEVSALRKPQTVAHEGTHQILQNIGVQQRLAGWPLWLVEGLAEYCASSRLSKHGEPTWNGIGQVTLIHMATLRDLDDPPPGGAGQPVVRDPRQPMVEYLITRSELTPTDYALSWALTYHLAIKRRDDFLDYLRHMSRIAPFEQPALDEQLRAFRSAFGPNLAKLGDAVVAHIRKLKQADALPYYAVLFEQNLPNGLLRRATMVSQSPSKIREWIETSTNPAGALPRWQALPQPTRTRALAAAEEWLRGG